MPRLPEIDATQLSPEQHVIYDRLMRERGHMRGPFAVWLRNAELCENTLKLQEMFASRVNLERRLLELMILVAARSPPRSMPGSSTSPTRSIRYRARDCPSHPRATHAGFHP